MTVINLPGQNLTADQWFFSAPTTVNTDATRAVIQVTDPNNQWFTRPGHVKVWGLQMEGYVGGPWDDQAPWAGWGWWLYESPPSGDPTQTLILPQFWIPFGRTARTGGVGLSLAIDSSAIVAAQGKRLRFAMQTDAAIRLGATITLT